MQTYERRFQTRINLEFYTRFAKEVIDGIENDTMMVFRPDDEEALTVIEDSDGTINLDTRATLPVSIREWLPVVCQYIRWESECRTAREGGVQDNATAYYYNNSPEVLWPVEGYEPDGPGALIAGITLRHEKCIGDAYGSEATQVERLKFVIAHELVHAFQAMRFIVPAFMDWPTFWEKVLDEGCRSNRLQTNSGWRTGFVDHYGTELELGEVMDFWPSQGQKWFDACY
jgi:hypothetical protein